MGDSHYWWISSPEASFRVMVYSACETPLISLNKTFPLLVSFLKCGWSWVRAWKVPNTSLRRNNFILSLYDLGDLEKQKISEVRKKMQTLTRRRKVQNGERVWRSWRELCPTYFLRVHLREQWTTLYAAEINAKPCQRQGCLTEEGNVDTHTFWYISIAWFQVSQDLHPLFWNDSPEISILPLSFLAFNSLAEV